MKRPSFTLLDKPRALLRNTYDQLSVALKPYLAPLASRWATMSKRDQRALIVMSCFLLLTLSWMLLISPVMQYANDSRAALTKAHEDLAWMQANAVLARQADNAGNLPPGQNLLAVINGDARQANLDLQRFEPDGESRVRITLENAVFIDVVRWIVGLENRYGIQVEHFQAEAQPQPGLANIRLTMTATP